jgi:hypothetical protein
MLDAVRAARVLDRLEQQVLLGIGAGDERASRHDAAALKNHAHCALLSMNGFVESFRTAA